MKLTGHTILVTGGTSGIGMALAVRLLARGNTVLTCGRDARKLDELNAAHRAIHTKVADTGDAASRVELFTWATASFPAVNILINSAGIQRQLDLTAPEDWSATRYEIAVNLEGPIHLASLFTPHLVNQRDAAILNVSSGLAFSPLARVPVYSATKAALHSYTLSLRHQLARTAIRVVEIIPPAVRTNLGGSHDFGTDLDEYADSVLAQLEDGRLETTYAFSARSSQASRAELDQMFAEMNRSR
jgi:uncharacterized oxidoreductase